MSSQPSSSEEGLNPSSKDGEPSHDSDIPPPRSSTRIAKGKEKQLEEDAYDEDEDDDGDTINTSYPPTTDEAAETRRVEEVRPFLAPLLPISAQILNSSVLAESAEMGDG